MWGRDSPPGGELLAQARLLASQQGLEDSAEALAHLAITHEASAEALALLGEVCLTRGEHRRALGWLTRAQQLREVCNAWGAASAADGLPQHGAALPSHPLQHIAACHEALGEHHEAKAALERIPAHHRTPGVWFLLGRLYTREQGRRSSAIAAYQSCLRQCPFAIQAALALAELRVPADEILELLQPAEFPATAAPLTDSPTRLVAAAGDHEAAARHPRVQTPAHMARPAEALDNSANTAADAAHLPGSQQEAAAGRLRDPAVSPQPASQQCQQQQQQQQQEKQQSLGRHAAAAACLEPSHRLECQACLGEQAAQQWVCGSTGSTAAAGQEWPPGSPVAVVAPSPCGSTRTTPAASPSPSRLQHSQRQQHSAKGSDSNCSGGSCRLLPATQQLLWLRSRGTHASAASRHAALLEQQSVPLAAAVGECDMAPLYLDFARRMVEAQAALAAEDTPRVLLAGRRLMEGQLARHPHAVLLAALCQADHGSATAALVLFEQARQLDLHSLAGADRHAGLLRQRGDSLALAQLAHSCMESRQQERRPEPWLVAAAAKELSAAPYEAIGLARNALERDACCAEAHLCVSRLLQHMAGPGSGGGAAALAGCEQALRLRRSLRAYRAAVDAALAAELPLEALRLAREAGAAFPASLDCRVLLGRALAAQPDELEAAVAVLVAVLEQDERSEEAALALAATLVSLGDAEYAAEVLQRQLRIAPSEGLHVAAAQLALHASRLEQALEHLHAALAHNPDSMAAAQGLAVVAALLGDAEGPQPEEAARGGVRLASELSADERLFFGC